MQSVGSILALDIATRTGWAYGRGEFGAETFKAPKGNPALRLRDFRVWIEEFLDDLGPELVVYEMPVRTHASSAQRNLSVALISRVEEAAAVRSIPARGCYSSALKKWATGSGTADKDAMIAAARREFPEAMISASDEADALLLLAWARAGCPVTEKKLKKRRTVSGGA
jgi:crossover junction endodeoxyribonuclease RuvC